MRDRREDSKSMLYIIRHGQTELNTKMLMQGRSDYPLNETGLAQAEESAGRLAAMGVKIDKVYTSPLKRAVRTARLTGESSTTSTCLGNAFNVCRPI